ncbi:MULTISPECIES: DUF1800 family protein [unclassified Chelatococcus]|uniref:DUF1800 domain-containing protein n=1 Tax=unclassified Chelatococcus TaxID=2638111 RepID=UPI001BCE640D|nr:MULTISPECIES: DUF1800 family protein [unclassified Chelatococcus]MBS7697796.1 DUF1800 family protein [Chelatococcus sp. YT9]MBX3559735.1 DUF1800 family protein [Chelatococcus sp.]
MASERDRRLAVFGANRFGLGVGADGLDAIADDIRERLRAEVRAGLSAGPVLPPGGGGLQTSGALFRAWREQEDFLRIARMPVRPDPARPPTPEPGTPGLRVGGMEPNKPVGPLRVPGSTIPQTTFLTEASVRMGYGLEPAIGFVERLALFWSNHFAVATSKGGQVKTLAGAFEREAIRPYVLGRFSDMLLAVETHPAMLMYLDNQQSVGPQSQAGKKQGKGLNENLAREILELHTLGVGSGYSQADVTSLARAITGWSVAYNDSPNRVQGRFIFSAYQHEPGDHTVLGTSYRAGGAVQGQMALLDLARHPATARHIARKLARHFTADAPDPKLVRRLERSFIDTDGDLAAVSLTLIEAPEAWSEDMRKPRLPYEFLIAGLRATGRSGVHAPREISPLLSALNAMGQGLWDPSGPNGFPDTTDAWISPEGMTSRLETAAMLGRQAPGTRNPNDVLAGVLGPLASQATRVAVSRADSRAQGLALLFMAPEFQWR